MEAASLAAGAGRVKFATLHRGPTTAAGLATPAAWAATVAPLLRALDALAVSGCAPVLPDGATGGNGAVVDGAGGLLVSRSAKTSGVALTPADVVRVVSFDAAAWVADTPADVAAAARVWAAHPFPGEEVWVRRGHGWFAVAGGEAAEDGAAGVVAVMRQRVLPFMGGGEGGGARPGHPLAGEVRSAHL
ncbi:hypothetical protein I4F81_010583 [Pyropia yezoensis]|uniref:Uncharacterized protein n=1 Tax=Pyropia yezoensis TaxID=2788 RepID=A0ACC3CD35_PYRYE|nr:hypothetical protein I4F81_010583 [Neopyropia yezoensis]